MSFAQVISRYRIIFIAIALSLLCHVFWITVFRIVSPDAGTKVKFSRVAFFGQILDRGAMEVRLSAHDRSVADQRYLDLVRRMPGGEPPIGGVRPAEAVTSAVINERLMALVDDAVSGPKPEPPADLGP